MTRYICIINLILWVPGFISSLFIVVCNTLQVQHERSLQTIDIIVTLITLWNLLTGVLNIIVVILLALDLCPNKAVIFLWEMISDIQKWVMSLICVFFCFKIVPGKSPIYLWLKNHFSVLAVSIILVGTICTAMTSGIDLFFEEQRAGSAESHINCTFTKLPASLSELKLFWKSLTYSSVLALMILPSSALMAHLITHMRRMRGNRHAKQDGVARAAFMIFSLAFEFVACASARYSLAGLFQYGLTEVSMNLYCLINLTLSTIIPITLIAGISALRQRITHLCFSASGNST